MGSMKLKRDRDTENQEMTPQLSDDDLSLGDASANSDVDQEHGENGAIQSVPKRIKRVHVKAVQDGSTLNGAYTGEVYKSNLFKLQVDDLLETVRPKFTRIEKSISELLQNVKSIIESIPARDSISISDAEKQFLKENKVTIPFPESRPKVSSSYLLHFAKPAHVNVTGSYPLRTTTWSNDKLDLDFIVTMPRSVFQDKDYLNHRYFMRRAYYLACVAAGIKSDPRHKYKLTFEYQNGNSNLPVLVLEPMLEKNHTQFRLLSRCRVVILTVPPTGTFDLNKLLPTRSCVRSKSADEEESVNEPTPFYNASILQDCLVTTYLKLQNESTQICDQYRDACSLGRVWLSQRGFSSNVAQGGFGNFEWATVMGLLLQGGGPKGLPVFSQGYSSYQLFKAMLQYLANKNLIKNPQVVGDSKKSPNFKALEGPVLFDEKRSHNVLYRLTPWSYRMLRLEAETTLEALGDTSLDSFESAFILRSDYYLCRYDAAIEISLPVLLTAIDSKASKADRLNIVLEQTHKILTTALTTRVNQINIHAPQLESWQIDHRPKTMKQNDKIIVGFVFDGSQINRTVDHGPSADMSKEAAEFIKFWGEKAELRRFKDGRILESLIWSPRPTNGSVFHQILSYVFKKHFGHDVEASMKYTENDPSGLFPRVVPFDADVKPYQELVSQFQELERSFRALDDVPLRVSQVSPADPQMSYSSLIYPFTAEKPKMLRPAAGVIQLEGSARWPDDMEAIQRTKIAFLIKLADSLESLETSIICRVGLENEDNLSLNQGYLDILNEAGMAFRLRIHHDREQSLLEKQLKEKSLQQQEKLEISLALAVHKQQFLRYPAHCQAIQNLAIRYPSFSQTMRLTKFWFSSHLLSSHFAEPLLEMFVAKTYTNPYPWKAPSSPVAGLLRTLLLLGRWDWHTEPWIVNLGTEAMRDEETAIISTRFEAWRKIDPAMNRVVMFVASNTDGDGTTWTDHGRPMKVVAARMTALAKASSDAIKSQGLNLDVRDLFSSDLSAFDFTIRLNEGALTKKSKSGGKTFKNIELQAESGIDVVGYDPIKKFVTEVEALYSNALVLFYSNEQRGTTGGLWNPQTRRTWKLRLNYSSMPSSAQLEQSDGDEDEEVDVNKNAVLNEIARLGGELVSKIECK